MEKETATEWLFKQLWEEPKDKFTWNAILSKAKEMEKQHVMEFLEEYDSYIFRGGNTSEEEYYNYIYGQ